MQKSTQERIGPAVPWMSKTPEFSMEGLCLKPEATHRGTRLSSNYLLQRRFMLPLSHYPFLFPPTLERRGTAFSHSHWVSPGIPTKWPKVQSVAKQQHMTNTKLNRSPNWIFNVTPTLFFKSYLKSHIYIHIYVHIIYIYIYIYIHLYNLYEYILYLYKKNKNESTQWCGGTSLYWLLKIDN